MAAAAVASSAARGWDRKAVGVALRGRAVSCWGGEGVRVEPDACIVAVRVSVCRKGSVVGGGCCWCCCRGGEEVAGSSLWQRE
jgi:hypothetical protein